MNVVDVVVIVVIVVVAVGRSPSTPTIIAHYYVRLFEHPQHVRLFFEHTLHPKLLA